MANPIFNKPKNKLEEEAIDFLRSMQNPCDHNVYEIMAVFAEAELSKLQQPTVKNCETPLWKVGEVISIRHKVYQYPKYQDRLWVIVDISENKLHVCMLDDTGILMDNPYVSVYEMRGVRTSREAYGISKTNLTYDLTGFKLNK